MQFERLNSEQEVKDLITFHNINHNCIAIDCETTSVKVREAVLLDVQLTGRNENHVVVFKGDYAKVLLDLNPSILLIGHNHKYDAHVLFRHGVNLLRNSWRDTLLIGHLVDENRQSNALDSYVKEIWQDDYKEKFWERFKTYEEAPEEEKLIYGCKDVYYTKKLYHLLISKVIEQKIPKRLLLHAHDLQASLLRTEISGINVDLEYLTTTGVRLKGRINELLPEMRALVDIYASLWEMDEYLKLLAGKKTDAGKANVKHPEFSFDSPKQLQRLLYGDLKLPEQVNEKTKAISTDESSLSKIEDKHPLVPKLLEYRGLQKTYTAFIEGTREKLDGGRIYPSFNVEGTVTGRISHSNPNLGQLPRSGGVRGIYIPNPGHVFLSADYSQLEVCLEANLTNDPALKKIFVEGLSKHDITAQALGIDRTKAKTLNFALQYWASHYKVAKILGVSTEKGKQIWENYWNLYAGCRALKAKTDAMVDRGEPIVTLLGRKRRFAVKDRKVWDGDYRQAYNFLIQGTGADLTSGAFYRTARYLEETGYGRALFTVHDEIIVEVKEEYSKLVEEKLIAIMVAMGEEIDLKIPLKAESSGPTPRWQD